MGSRDVLSHFHNRGTRRGDQLHAPAVLPVGRNQYSGSIE
jgi:hypothetical protein